MVRSYTTSSLSIIDACKHILDRSKLDLVLFFFRKDGKRRCGYLYPYGFASWTSRLGHIRIFKVV